MPALRASRVDLWETLKVTVGSITGGSGSLFLRKGLVTAQVALSFLLLFGAGLFVRSLQNLQKTDTGVALDNLVAFQLSPALSDYDDASSDGALSAVAGAAAVVTGREVRSIRRRPDPLRRRMGQQHVGRGPPPGRRRGHAGVHERAVARLLRDDADPDSGGA